MKNVNTVSILVLVMLAGLLGFCKLTTAGNLEPSASPRPTMKTLDEVEPRMPIPTSDTPTVTLTITQSGSYYLTGDRLCAGTGIEVDVNDVTIDLMGYTLKGSDEDYSSGIHISEHNNVEIRNGTVRNFSSGVSGGANKNLRVISIRAVSNLKRGIFLYEEGGLVKNCTASDNGISGIEVGWGYTVTGNVAYNNGNSSNSYLVSGIRVADGCTVTGNTVVHNGDLATGSFVEGICAGTGCTVTGNTVGFTGSDANGPVIHSIHAGVGSTVTGNTADRNGNNAACDVYGIITGGGCTVTGNTTHDNGNNATGDVYGIFAGTGCMVTNNTAYYNGNTATGSTVRGIHTDNGNTVTGNTACQNGVSATGTVYGIYLQGNSLVDRNTTWGNNGTNMDTTLSSCTYGLNHVP